MWTKNQEVSALFFRFTLVLISFSFIFLVTNSSNIESGLCIIPKYSIEDALFYIVHNTFECLDAAHEKKFKRSRAFYRFKKYLSVEAGLFFVSFYSVLPLSFLAPVSFPLSLKGKPFVMLVR